MSILICGVKYPKEPLTLIIYPDGTVSSVYDNQHGTAIPVPPHGRFGDELLTRADLFRRGTDEEIASWIAEIVGCGECEKFIGFRMCDAYPGKTCAELWTGWFKSGIGSDYKKRTD